MNIQCKRVYDPAEKSDGYRVLVDRLWPRGVKKSDLIFNEWNKALTPSSDLRKAFHAELIDFSHFSEQYRAELAQQQQEGKRQRETLPDKVRVFRCNASVNNAANEADA